MKTKIINRRGEVVDHDDNVIIPDGHGVHVPIMLQDAAPDATHLTDALGRPAGSRPGHVFASDANEAAAHAAHHAYKARIVDAWRNTTTDADVEQLGGVYSGKPLAAASPKPADVTPADPDAALAAYTARLQNAWRTPAPASAPPGNVSFLGSFGGDGGASA
jgi:hypothetical protein